MTPNERLVFPLDVPNLDDAIIWIKRLQGRCVFKVGLELFTACGPAAVEAVLDTGSDCFLDLKLHDIPATMAGAAERAVRMGVRYLTIHASAGPEALRAVAEIAKGSPTTILAVTVLTSIDLDALARMGSYLTPVALAGVLALEAREAGVRGLVCSTQELIELRRIMGDDAVIAVPGIRPAGADVQDQKRVGTPAQAIKDGASLLVVGRPIRNAPDPVAAADAILAEIRL